MKIEFSDKESRKFNNIGQRATYGLTLFKLKKLLNNLAVFTADTSTSAGLDRFKNNFPESFFDCGIAEQCMIASAAGYVEEGGVALASTFSPFLTLRAAEQLRLTMGYMNLPIILTGLASGLALGHLGYTHCCVEDLPLMMNIPNIFTYVPSDCFELNRVLPYLIQQKKPTYIRLTGLSKMPPVHNRDFEIDFFSPIEISKKGNNLMIISSGSISSNAIAAINSLSSAKQNNLSFYVLPFIDRVKTPLKLANLLKSFENVLVLDEGMYGGISSLICKIISDNNLKINFKYKVHPDKYLECGSYDFMLTQCGLDKENILKTIEKLL